MTYEELLQALAKKVHNNTVSKSDLEKVIEKMKGESYE